MRTIVKAGTKRELEKRIKEMAKRGWEPLHEPKEVLEYMNRIHWVCVLHKPDIKPNHKNRSFRG